MLKFSDFNFSYWHFRTSLVAQLVKNLPSMCETWVQTLGWEDPLEDGMATHSSILAWRIPMDGGACRATVYRVTQNQAWLKWLSMHACIGEGNGNPLQCSCLENPRDGGAWWACCLWGLTESDTTEPLSTMLNIQMNRQVCPTRNMQAGQGERTSFGPVCSSAVWALWCLSSLTPMEKVPFVCDYRHLLISNFHQSCSGLLGSGCL